VQALNSLTLLALVRVLEPDTSLVVLDWQHPGVEASDSGRGGGCSPEAKYVSM